jgi:hypothetical protein
MASPAFTPPGSPTKGGPSEQDTILIQQARVSCQLKKLSAQDNSYFTYVLELQNGYIYVGRTLNIYQRLLTHFFDWEQNGVEWIKLHGPVKSVIEIFQNCSKDDEQYLTLLWMHRMGPYRVRGGPWTNSKKPSTPTSLHTFVYDHERLNNRVYLSREAIDTIIKTITAIHDEYKDSF